MTDKPEKKPDETVAGGVYINDSGYYVNANGEFVDSKGNPSKEPVEAPKQGRSSSKGAEASDPSRLREEEQEQEARKAPPPPSLPKKPEGEKH